MQLKPNLFIICLFFSTILHGALLVSNPHFNISLANKTEKTLQIEYLKSIPLKEKKQINPRLRNDALLKLAPKGTMEKALKPSRLDKEKLFRNAKITPPRGRIFNKPKLTSPDVIAIKKKITLTSDDKNKINSVAYVTHTQIIREKIKRALYQHYSGTDTGEVCISFVVSNNGTLIDARVVEDKSSPNPKLCRIALLSLKYATPFPPFPKDLDYPQLSFSLVVSFEIE
ncbi:MAG: energy transducer TonB [Candidatus Omnitrophica bacterium]|nr:energy transducer TonB [Candidatus Omnitrophota bacterium]